MDMTQPQTKGLTMLTTPALIQFLQLREGFRKRAYDDKHPDRKLTAETEIEGTLTIGYGTTVYPDGTPVSWHDTVSKSEATDYVSHYVRETIEPALENLIHVPLAGCQYDALGSCIYQYGEGEVAGWNLIRLINSPDGMNWQDIAREWISGTVFWNANPDLGPIFWGRRIMELFMFLGLDYRAGQHVPALSDPLEAAEAMGFDGTLPKPPPIVDEDLFKELEIPTRGADEMKKVITDPTPNTPITTEDANNMQLESMKTGLPIDYGVPLTPMTNKVPVEAVEYLDPKDKEPGNVTVKRIEKSKRGKGFAKQQTGKELASVGGIGAAAGIVGAAEPVVKVVDKYPAQTLGYVFAGLMLFGLLYYAYGEWQRQRGEDEAEDLLG
jgi:GH24 family phage-related lysozyme (muramidase)